MLRRVLGMLLLMFAVLASRQARASGSWTDAHVSGEDVRAVVQRDGGVVVTHAITYRVLAGTLRSIAITGFEDDLRLRPTAAVTSGDGHALGASVVRDDKDVVHVTVDDPKGLKRGDYRFELVYETSLVGRVTRDGAFDRIRFALPPLHDGVDGARLVLDLPSAPTEPHAVIEGDGDPDLPTLRRTAERDELELVRPHVAKGEPAIFYARVDPKALSEMKDPALRDPVVEKPAERPRERPSITVAIVVALAALSLFGIALAKGRVLAGLEATALGLVPLGPSARAALAAALFGGGVLAESAGRAILGAVLVAASLPLVSWRIAARPRGVRGPATWLVVKPEEAFARRPSRADWLDATTPRGALVFVATAVAVAIACRLSRAAGASAPYFLAIDALALVPIFLTGTSRQTPPNAAREGATLAPLARALSKADTVKTAPFARVTPDGRLDEIRLLVSPRLAMAGVGGVEIGVAWQRASGACLPSFEVLARVHDGTFAAAKMAAAFPKMRALPGRKPEERVFRFEPDGPSAASAAALVRGLAETLRDRRLVTAPPAEGADRRLPPNSRKLQEAAA